MTLPTREHPIAVSLPQGGHGPALRFAVREAELHRCGIRVVHVYQGGRQAQVEGLELLQQVVSSLEERVGQAVAVSGELVLGQPVAGVLASSPDARAVVVQHREVLYLTHALMGPAHPDDRTCRMPIVSLPDDWEPQVGPRGPVAVGIDDPDPGRAHEPLRLALAIAIAHHTSLQVVHSWHFPQPYDDEVEDRIGPEWASSARRSIRQTLDALPDVNRVPVEIVVRHAEPAPILLDVGRSAEALVLGRHGSHLPLWWPRVGPVTHAALHQAACPVVLVEAGISTSPGEAPASAPPPTEAGATRRMRG